MLAVPRPHLLLSDHVALPLPFLLLLPLLVLVAATQGATVPVAHPLLLATGHIAATAAPTAPIAGASSGAREQLLDLLEAPELLVPLQGAGILAFLGLGLGL